MALVYQGISVHKKNLVIVSITATKVSRGDGAAAGQFPHQVSLTKLDRNNNTIHFCGASIIHPFLLICAAHCFTTNDTRNITAIAGEHSIGSSNDNEQVRDVIHVYKHETFNSATWDNDIAVLVLNQSLNFAPFNVKPIKLRDPSWKLPGLEI